MAGLEESKRGQKQKRQQKRENGDEIDVHSFNGGDVETTKEWEKLAATIFSQ
jgi:hypothetical protein